MPAYAPGACPPSPTSGSGFRTGMAEPKTAHFASQPVTGIFRPLHSHELRALDRFEAHARCCRDCYKPLDVYNRGDSLCHTGFELAKDVTYLVGSKDQATKVFPHDRDEERLEIPTGYNHTLKMLCAVELDKRYTRRVSKPVVTYPDPFTVPPQGASYVKIYSYSDDSKRKRGKSKTFTAAAGASPPTPAEFYRMPYRSNSARHPVMPPSTFFDHWR